MDGVCTNLVVHVAPLLDPGEQCHGIHSKAREHEWLLWTQSQGVSMNGIHHQLRGC